MYVAVVLKVCVHLHINLYNINYEDLFPVFLFKVSFISQVQNMLFLCGVTCMVVAAIIQ